MFKFYKFNSIVFLLLLSSCSSLSLLVQSHPDFRNFNNGLKALRLSTSDDPQSSTAETKEEFETSAVIEGKLVLEDDPLRDAIVLIQITKGKGTSVCTGALIDGKHILTAAHCIFKIPTENLKVILLNKDSTTKHVLGVNKIDIHPDYSGRTQSYSDLAILTLKGSSDSSRTFLPLVTNIKRIDSDDVTLAGYGVTDEKSKDSMILRKVKKSLKNDIHFRGKIVGVMQKSHPGGFCRGDSGAPIIVNEKNIAKVVGINSFTVELEEGQECHSASVAISVPHNLEWIKGKIE